MTTPKQNERATRRLFEAVFVEHDYDAIDDLVAEDYVLHDPSLPEPVHGVDGFREMAEMGATVVDGTIEIDQLLAFDDYVVARWTQTGTHVGRMGQIEPTNQTVTITGIEIDRFEDGKLAETWGEVNLLNMLVQIGEVSPDLFAPPVPAGD